MDTKDGNTYVSDGGSVLNPRIDIRHGGRFNVGFFGGNVDSLKLQDIHGDRTFWLGE